MVNLIRFILGYVSFEGICPSPEKFMNLIASSRLNVWNVKSSKNKISGCIKASEYRSLKFIIYKTRSKIRIKEKHGMQFKLKPYKRRFGLIIGGILFIIILNFLSLFIWTIEIDDNTEIPKENIYNALSEIGIKPGVKRSSIDSQITEQKIMNQIPDIAWLAININGSVMNIELNDRIKPPEIESVSNNSNLVASRAGQITRLEVYSGTILVKPGDVVLIDQLLVSGIFEDDLGGTTIKRSVGKIYAKTLRELKQEVPLKKETLVQKAPTVKRKHINFFGLNIPISLTAIPNSDYQFNTQYSQAELFGTKLPISLYTELFIPIDKISTDLNYDQAQAIAEENLKIQEDEIFKDSTILNKTVKYQIANEKFILIANYICEENIAIEKPLEIQLQPENNSNINTDNPNPNEN